MDLYSTFMALDALPPERRQQQIDAVRSLGWLIGDQPRPGTVRLLQQFPSVDAALDAASQLDVLVDPALRPAPAALRDVGELVPGERQILRALPSESTPDLLRLLIDRGLTPLASSMAGHLVVARGADGSPSHGAAPAASGGGAPDGGAPTAAPAAAAAAKPAGAAGGDGGAPAPVAPPPPTPAAGLAAVGLHALTAPQWLWRRLSSSDDDAFVAEALATINAERARFARSVQWQLAPELELLERAPVEDAGEVAKDLLLARAGLMPHQVALETKRAELLDEAIELADELRRHARKWRTIANWGVGILVLTVLAAIASLYLVLEELGDGGIDGWEAATVVFALAVFAVSPAVLLLRERPLQGVDAFMPAGRPDAGTAPDGRARGGDGGRAGG